MHLHSPPHKIKLDKNIDMSKNFRKIVELENSRTQKSDSKHCAFYETFFLHCWSVKNTRKLLTKSTITQEIKIAKIGKLICHSFQNIVLFIE